jgi:hypothetical protein
MIFVYGTKSTGDKDGTVTNIYELKCLVQKSSLTRLHIQEMRYLICAGSRQDTNLQFELVVEDNDRASR